MSEEDKKASLENHIKSGLIEFAKLGFSFVFLANGSAIIAILSQLHRLPSDSKCALIFILAVFLLGLFSAIFSTFSAYMSHRNLTENKT